MTETNKMELMDEILFYLKQEGVTMPNVAEHFKINRPALYRIFRRDALTPLMAILNMTGGELIIKGKNGTIINLAAKVKKATNITAMAENDKRKTNANNVKKAREAQKEKKEQENKNRIKKLK